MYRYSERRNRNRKENGKKEIERLNRELQSLQTEALGEALWGNVKGVDEKYKKVEKVSKKIQRYRGKFGLPHDEEREEREKIENAYDKYRERTKEKVPKSDKHLLMELKGDVSEKYSRKITELRGRGLFEEIQRQKRTQRRTKKLGRLGRSFEEKARRKEKLLKERQNTLYPPKAFIVKDQLGEISYIQERPTRSIVPKRKEVSPFKKLVREARRSGRYPGMREEDTSEQPSVQSSFNYRDFVKDQRRKRMERFGR